MKQNKPRLANKLEMNKFPIITRPNLINSEANESGKASR